MTNFLEIPNFPELLQDFQSENQINSPRIKLTDFLKIFVIGDKMDFSQNTALSPPATKSTLTD